MKLSDCHEYSLVEATFFPDPYLVIEEEGEAPRWKFRYDNYQVDPTPDILLLGSWRHPNTGNNLVGGINTNYLSKKQVEKLAKVLPQIMKAPGLQRRYWLGRQLLPDIFNNFYRTYNAAHIRGVKQDVMYPKYGFTKAASNWIKNKVGNIFKSKKQKEKDSQPQFPDDLQQINNRLDQVVQQLQQSPDERPSQEPENTPEMRRAREAFQAYQRDRISDALQDEPDTDDIIMRQAEQDAIKTAKQQEQEEREQMRDAFEKERAENAERNKDLDNPDIDIDVDIDEAITYYDPRVRRYVSEVVVENIEKKWPHIKKSLLTRKWSTILGDEDDGSEKFNIPPGLSNRKVNDLYKDFKNGVLNQHAAGDIPYNDFPELSGLPHHGLPRKEQEQLHVYLFNKFTDEVVKPWIIQSDPASRKSNGRKTPFTNHIVRWLIHGTMDLPQDIDTVHDLLKQYQQLKNNQGTEVPNLDDISSPGRLRKEIMEFKGKGIEKIESKQVGQHGDFAVYRLDDWEEAEDYLCDSGWCVGDKHNFDWYEPPFYLVVKKRGINGKRVALLHVGNAEIMDVHNQPLKPEELKAIAPIVDDAYYDFLQLAKQEDEEEDTSTISIPRRAKNQLKHQEDFLKPVLGILGQMPKTLSMVDPMDVAGMTYQKDVTDIRWNPEVEQKIAQDPYALIGYLGIVYGETGTRIEPLEKLLLEGLKPLVGKSIDPIITRMAKAGNGHAKIPKSDSKLLIESLGYYGKLIKDNEEWPEFKVLIRAIREGSQENKKIIPTECLMLVKNHGMSTYVLAAMDDIFRDWIKQISNVGKREFTKDSPLKFDQLLDMMR